MWAYAPPLIMEAAIRNRVFDTLDAGPKTVEEVAASTGASTRGLRAILNTLVGLELLTKEPGDRYGLTPESATYLVRGKPRFLGGMIQHTSTQLVPKWLQLGEIVRTGKPAVSVNQEGDGAAFFQEFVEDLFPFNYAAARRLAVALDVANAAGAVRVLDLAAGSGVWSIALAQQSPHVEVWAVDWPAVLPATRRTAEKHGVADRFHYVEGDLLTADFGAGFQVAVLGHILHSEGEERSRALLKKSFAALAPGGTIAIAEFLVDEGRTSPLRGLIFAVNMLVNTDRGDTFTLAEIGGWLTEAGFRAVRTVETSGPSPLILADKPL
jgi:ubiquinone/menaquinone biosynthesis C-methylase UbiE